MKLPSLAKNTLVISIFILANFLGLWFLSILHQSKIKHLSQSINQPQSSHQSTPSPSQTETNDNSTNFADLSQQLLTLESNIATLAAKVNLIPQATPTPKVISQATGSVTRSTNQAKEEVIFVGNGSTTNRDWTDITGASIYINAADYRAGTQVVLEASLSIIGGEVYARVKNATTNGVYHQTQIMHNTSTSTWKSSAPFYLSQNTNQYLIQLRSSSGETANLHAARFRITQP